MSASASTDVSTYRGLLSTYLRPQVRWLVWLAALLLTGIGVEVASPLLLGRFVDGALSGAAQDTLLVLGSAFLVASIVQQCLLVGATYVGERVAWNAPTRSARTLRCTARAWMRRFTSAIRLAN